MMAVRVFLSTIVIFLVNRTQFANGSGCFPCRLFFASSSRNTSKDSSTAANPQKANSQSTTPSISPAISRTSTQLKLSSHPGAIEDLLAHSQLMTRSYLPPSNRHGNSNDKNFAGSSFAFKSIKSPRISGDTDHSSSRQPQILQFFDEPSQLVDNSVISRENTESTINEGSTPNVDSSTSSQNPLTLQAAPERNRKQQETRVSVIRNHHYWKEFLFNKLDLTEDNLVRNQMIIAIYSQSIKESITKITELTALQNITLDDDINMFLLHQGIQELNGVIQELYKIAPEVYKTQCIEKLNDIIQNISGALTDIYLFVQHIHPILSISVMAQLLAMNQALQAVSVLINYQEISSSRLHLKSIKMMIDSAMTTIVLGSNIQFKFKLYKELNIHTGPAALIRFMLVQMFLYSSRTSMGQLHQEMNVKFEIEHVIKYDPFDIVICYKLTDNGDLFTLTALEHLQNKVDNDYDELVRQYSEIGFVKDWDWYNDFFLLGSIIASEIDGTFGILNHVSGSEEIKDIEEPTRTIFIEYSILKDDLRNITLRDVPHIEAKGFDIINNDKYRLLHS